MQIPTYDIDFKGTKASEGRHSIHDYPAMLHYKLVDFLLSNYGYDKKVLYDPFCGSGVSLIEGLKRGMKVYGTDINPLALLIAYARSYTPKKPIPINSIVQSIRKAKPDVPKVKNLYYWFKDYVVEELGKIREALKDFREKDYYPLLLCTFSQTVRLCSNNRKGEFKRFRISESELQNFNPKPIETFIELLKNYEKILREEPIKGKPKLTLHDVRQPISFKNYDIVITSPPYGDSRTTVAYGEFSSFSLEWIYGMNPFGDTRQNIDRLSLGGEKKNLDGLVNSRTFNKIYEKLRDIDQKRAEDVLSFFLDMQKSCVNIVENLKSKGVVCFVVGNRKVKGIEIPTSDIIREFFENLGLLHIETLSRRIHNKRMPVMVSPTNKVGEKDFTMRHEHVVIMRKL